MIGQRRKELLGTDQRSRNFPHGPQVEIVDIWATRNGLLLRYFILIIIE